MFIHLKNLMKIIIRYDQISVIREFIETNLNKLIEFSFRLRLKPDTDVSDQSLNSTSSSTKTSFNFLESLSKDIPIENKHPDAKS
jgi:hypothetical protein